MHRVPKAARVALVIYVIFGLMTGTAEAAYHLVRANGTTPTPGLRFDPGLQGVVTAPPAYLPAPVAPRTAPVVHRAPTRLSDAGNGRCGGDLPSCAILACESGGDLTVRNKQGSSASGKWQITRGTWDGYRGYPEARDAPESVQDDKARELKASRGEQPWESCY